jgi:hypothetical protein
MASSAVAELEHIILKSPPFVLTQQREISFLWLWHKLGSWIQRKAGIYTSKGEFHVDLAVWIPLQR